MNKRKIKKYGLSFTKPIHSWDEALPLGNGQLGCLVYGNGSPLIFALDRVDIWDTTPNPATLRDDFKYREMIRLVQEGPQNHQEIVRRFDDIYFYPTPTKLPVGHLELKFTDQPRESISSHLDIYDATARIQIDNTSIQTYIHSEKPVGIIKIKGSIPEISLISPLYRDTSYKEGTSDHEKCFENKLAALDYENAEHFQENNLLWFVQKTKCELVYSIVAAYKKTVDGCIIAYTVATNHTKDNWLAHAKELVLQQLCANEYKELQSHKKSWHDFYNSEIDIPDKVLEKTWYRNNYLLNACSREGFYPMPLQGVWTADNGCLPPWKGDYHHDLNTQMSYWSYMKANQLSNGKCFVDYLWNIREKGIEFAKRFYECDGLLYPTVSAIDGTPLGGWPQYSINIVNNIWLCRAFDDYYTYTGDITFLKERAYPYFKLVEQATEHWLKEDENEKYKLPLSSSPEVFDNTFRAWQKPNTSNDLSLLRYLFLTLKRFSEILQTDETDKWQSFLNKLEDLPLTKDGAIMMNSESPLPESHRHLGHLMAIYPLHMINYDTDENKRIIDASVRQLEELGTGFWCCFTFSWAAALYSLQHNGNAAWYNLRLFTDHYLSPNGFNLNFDYKNYGITSWHSGRPFTLESNFGFNDALQEMLLHTHGGILHVFPAIPDDFNGTAAFENFRGYNGITVSAKMEHKSCVNITLHSPCKQSLTIFNSFAADQIQICTGDKQKIISCKQGDTFTIELLPNDETVISAQ